MISTYKNKKTTWIDLENPTKDEVRKLVDEFDLSPETANELLFPTDQVRSEFHGDYIYLVLHFPSNNNDHILGETKLKEIDFVIGKNFIITTRYNSIDAIHEFSKMFEMNSLLNKNQNDMHSGLMFYHMIQNLYDSLRIKLDNIKDLLTDIEKRIFKGEEKDMVIELSKLNRLILRYKEALAEHEEILRNFESIGLKFFQKDFQYKLESILNEYRKIRSILENRSEYLNDLRITNDSILTTKQNEIMKTLTIMAFIVLPPSLLASFFGMNSQNLPFIGRDDDYIIIVMLMIIITSLMFLFFRFKKWL